jgi:uncharacterized membrane protein SpoIIM required for sporulation
MAKKKNSKKELKHHINDAFSYVIESRKYIYFMIGLFVFFAFVGYFLVPTNLKLSGLIDNALKQIILKTEGLSGVELILFIFVNNLTVSLYSLFSGIFLGIYPTVSSVVNGAILGYVFSKVYAVSGFSQFWRILPHGIFELPAIFISMGLGAKLGLFFISKNPIRELGRRFYNSLKVFFFIIIPLLIAAAIIEGLLISLFR